MAYRALHHTYHPNGFDEVVGQKYVVQTLQHAVERRKIAHAYLFYGPRGTEKIPIARISAKAINCENPNRKPCLECDNCGVVQDGSHPDIIEIDTANNNGVEEVRILIEKVKYAPLRGRYKIYIIDKVHMMSTGAFNALLEMIEEPPEYAIFILAATKPHKVLPTIISCCQQFDFTKAPCEEIVQRIHTILEREQIICKEGVIRIIAQPADGRLRDTLSTPDQCIAYAQNHIQVHHINEIYGITTIQEKLDLYRHIYGKDAASLLNATDQLIEEGIDIRRLTVDLIEMLKGSVIFEHTRDASLLHILNSEEVLTLIDGESIAEKSQMIHLLVETYDKYRSAVDIKSYFKVYLLQMLDVKATMVIMTILHPLGTPRQKQKPMNAVNNVSRGTSREKPILEVPMDDEPFTPCDTPVFDLPVTKSAESSHIPGDIVNREIAAVSTKALRPLDNRFILGLLVGANKSGKAKDNQHFQEIPEFMFDFKYVKYGSPLKNTDIVGSGNTYIVVCIGSQAVADEIDEMDSKDEFHDLITVLMGENKEIFTIFVGQQKHVIREFKDCMIADTLPNPIQIEAVTIERKEVKELTQEEAALDLFGRENIIITEG